MKILFLDDDPARHQSFRALHLGDDVAYAWSYEEACTLLAGAGTPFDLASLDHDLTPSAAMGEPAPGERTGLHVAEFIVALPPERRPRLVVVHSWNDRCRRRMQDILRAGEVPCRIEFFGGE